jgi:hypothetical protein
MADAPEFVEGVDGDNDPLEWLPEKQQHVIAILEETLTDEDLKVSVIGGMLAEIDEWGKIRTLIRAPVHSQPN